MRKPALALLFLGGCHLVAGIEDAELIEPLGGACAVDAACDDDNPCTIDTCVAGACQHTPVDGDAPEDEQAAGDCSHVVCVAGELDAVPDDGDLPVDGTSCTEDRCVDGAPENPPLAGGTPCDEDGGQVCDGEGRCVGCFSNADCTLPETCGGAGTVGACGCTPTPCSAVGLTCGFHPDDGCGDVLSCNNMAQDGDETDVDCGGTVGTCSTRCAAGKICQQSSDCASGLCCQNVCCAQGEICNGGICELP